MTKEAFAYLLNELKPPLRKTLWLYGSPLVLQGDLYTTYADAAKWQNEKNHKVAHEPDALPQGYECVFIDCPKQHLETEGLIALALSRSSGWVVAVAANDAGGNRLKSLFGTFGLEANQLSKHHCKIVWVTDAPKANAGQIEKSLTLLKPKQHEIEARLWWTVPGLFGWDKIDSGSKMLMNYVPSDLRGVAADFGCGFGYLSTELLTRCGGISSIEAYDNDWRALLATKANAGSKLVVQWQDMKTYNPLPKYDIIVMNPPFHAGKQMDITLGELFVRKAYASLRAGGQLFMVANQKLPYENVVVGLKIQKESDGFKIMTVKKP
jgi:16S rRNA (guanine1207-N2)-methyltransferase